MFPGHQFFYSNVKFNIRPFQVLKISRLFCMLCSKDFLHLCPRHARPIHSNGVIIIDFRLVPAILGSYPLYIRTISYFSEIATSFPTILRGYIVTFFLPGGWLLPPLPCLVHCCFLLSLFFCVILKHHCIRQQIIKLTF